MIAGSIEIQLLANLARLQKDMDSAKTMVGGAMANIERTVGFAQKAIIGLGAGFTLAALIGNVNKAINTLGDLDDMAQKTGSSVENLSRLQKVAAQYGADFGNVNTAIGKLAVGLSAVDDSSNKTMAALRGLGISNEFIKKSDPSQVFIEVSKRLQDYKDSANKAGLATDLFGKSGRELLPYLNDVADNVDRFTGASAKSAAQAAAFQDALGGLQVRSQEFFQHVATDVLPAMSDFIGALGDTINNSNKLYQDGSATNWADSVALGFARVVDVLMIIPNLVKAVGGSFSAVAGDIKFMGAVALNTGPAAVGQIAKGKNPLTELKAALAERNKTLADANKQYDDLWNKPANQTEQAMLARIAARGTAGASGSPYVSPNADKKDLNYKSGEAANDAAGMQKLASAYDALVQKSSDYVTAMQHENAEGEKLTAGQKQLADLREFLDKNTKSLTASQIANLKTLMAETEAEDAYSRATADKKDRIAAWVEWQIKLNAENQAHTDGLNAATQAYEKLVSNEQDQLKNVQDQIDLARLGTKGFADLENARTLEAAAAFEQNAAYAEQNGVSAENIKSMKDRAQALRDLAAARSQLADKKIELDQLNKIKSWADETWRSLSDGLTNALFRGFENGKGFGQNFIDTLKNLAKTTVLKFTAEIILNPIKETISGIFSSIAKTAVSGSGVGGASSLTGLTSSGSSIFSAITSGFTKMNNAYFTGIAKFGQSVSNLGLDKLGKLITVNSALIGKVLPYSGAVFSLLKGDIKGAAFQGAGVAIGTAIGGPIGGFIGGALGSVVGGLFGKKKAPRFDSSVNGVYSNGIFTASQGATDYKKLGADAALGNLGQRFSVSLDDLLTQFGVTGTKISTSNRLVQKRKSSYGLFEANFSGNTVSAGVQGSAKDTQGTYEALVAKVMGETLVTAVKAGLANKLPQYLADVFKRSGSINVAGLNNILAIKGMYESLNTLPPVFNSIKFAIESFATSKSIDFLKERMQAISTYTDLFYSDQEKLSALYKQLNSQFTDLGVSVPQSRDEFRALVDGIDTTSISGYGLFNALVDLAPQMDSYYKALQAQADATDQAAESAKAMADALSTDKFKTLFDYTKAQAYIAAGQSTAGLPGFAVGTNSVPFDMPAMIHSGERIIPAADNRELMARLRNPSADMRALVDEVRALRAAVASFHADSNADSELMLKKTDRIDLNIDRITNDGFIASKFDAEGNEAVIKVDQV